MENSAQIFNVLSDLPSEMQEIDILLQVGVILFLYVVLCFYSVPFCAVLFYYLKREQKVVGTKSRENVFTTLTKKSRVLIVARSGIVLY